MKTIYKTNFYGTASLSLSDKDDAQIFESANRAIHWIKLTGLVDKIMDGFDDGLFVIAFKSPVYENKDSGLKEYSVYSVFNFGAKAAIHVKEFRGENCVAQRFMTRKEADKNHPEY